MALGGVLVLVSKWASRLITPANPGLGMAKVLVVNVWVLAVAAVSLAVCYAYAREAIEWFGVSLAIGFLGAASVELVRFGIGTTHRSPKTR